jgi:hypothetical protein
MIAEIDLFARRCVAWPLVFIGYGLTCLAALLIQAGAWLLNLDVSEWVD